MTSFAVLSVPLTAGWRKVRPTCLRVAQLEKVAEAHEDLKARYAKLEGELAMRKRGQHGKKSEKTKDT